MAILERSESAKHYESLLNALLAYDSNLSISSNLSFVEGFIS
ncbi:hypothetical protein VCRA2117O380_20006 [Vibrio crassostreae]|nr:hypothetical protein VCRA2117O379_20006 [Vibrio crassostreae]CAK1977459.1 hypothetical protein VCRA2117O380_20006 [Vibrio crassostreae]CAK2012561.1 hypothetical protein VCRA2119O381_350034 [Vibrio crassostreae]CAK2028032.1 hypothetical protein VCRA2119O382_20488 [Vibrio crassostreae]CAK2472992.1 hypothetical protein VCRA2113O350_20006 [Vibrio crassostreae]